ncbi:hypothetical protein [Maritimibacter alexandrii]|uniref:hypothetical protein n=1 Tax=Maritimibacter alexandrii TaxID=2570355 RepID=UPI001107DB9B|nr:hypothetical protein [Maritimibacter alexandrii]
MTKHDPELDEMEISPTMLSAGEKVLEDWKEIDTLASLARKVYTAMAEAAQDCQVGRLADGASRAQREACGKS